MNTAQLAFEFLSMVTPALNIIRHFFNMAVHKQFFQYHFEEYQTIKQPDVQKDNFGPGTGF